MINSEIIGWIGTGLLVLSYIILYFSKNNNIKLFLTLDVVASFILTIYALLNQDYQFIIVNGVITGVLAGKLKKEIEK